MHYIHSRIVKAGRMGQWDAGYVTIQMQSLKLNTFLSKYFSFASAVTSELVHMHVHVAYA